MFEKGLKKFGNHGKLAAEKELDQLHKRGCFRPIDVSTKSEEEKRKTQKGMLLLTEKNNAEKTVKGRLVYDGSKTRDWVSREEAASPTVSMESISLTTVIDAKEKRDIMTADIPNAFIQAHMPKIEKGEDRVIMKISGTLVELLVKLAPTVYGPFVVFEKGKKVIYLEVLSKEKREDFHTFVAKRLFAAKRARPDIQPTIAVLTTQVREPTDGDWKKLI